MNNNELINDAIEYINELQGANSGGHDAAHSLRVYKNALVILDKEAACDRTVVLLAAILHDADDDDQEADDCDRCVLGSDICYDIGDAAGIKDHADRVESRLQIAQFLSSRKGHLADYER